MYIYLTKQKLLTTMRKSTNKHPREIKISRENTVKKSLNPSQKILDKIPVYSVVDDEEYFFEVEDF